MVLPEWIEHSTSPLPRGCSTTELRQRRRERISDHAGPVEPSGLPAAFGGFIPAVMVDGGKSGDLKRAERLKAALRANLKRRKAQSKSRSQAGATRGEA